MGGLIPTENMTFLKLLGPCLSLISLPPGSLLRGVPTPLLDILCHSYPFLTKIWPRQVQTVWKGLLSQANRREGVAFVSLKSKTKDLCVNNTSRVESKN